MSPLVTSPELSSHVRRFSPYLQSCLERAARTADRLHADEVALEHLLLVMLGDEECGAHHLILHAFADPETIRAEVLALAPGILVVGSGSSLPFSHRGVHALFAARRNSSAAGVDLTCLFLAALGELEPGVQEGLRSAGLEAEIPASLGSAQGEDSGVFRAFDDEARRSLGAAGRAAQQFSRESISPAHLVLGCLERAPEKSLCGLRLGPARMRLGGQDEDIGTPPERDVAPELTFAKFVSNLPDGAGTAQALHGFCVGGSEELRLLLFQQRITEELTRSGASAFPDPDSLES